MFEGNMFLPETGMPIWKMDRISTELAVWLPDPFTVATCMLKSLTIGWLDCSGRDSAGDTSKVDIDEESFGRGILPSALPSDYMRNGAGVEKRAGHSSNFGIS
jgi:hypothetical protein